MLRYCSISVPDDVSHHTATGEPSTVLVQNTPAHQWKKTPAKLLDNQPVFDKCVKNTVEKKQQRKLEIHSRKTKPEPSDLAKTHVAQGQSQVMTNECQAQGLQLSAQQSQQPADCNDSLQVGTTLHQTQIDIIRSSKNQIPKYPQHPVNGQSVTERDGSQSAHVQKFL